MAESVKDAILRIAAANAAQGTARRMLTLGTSSGFNPTEMISNAYAARDIPLPRMGQMNAVDLAKKLKPPGASSSTDDGTVQTIAAKMLSAGEASQNVTKAVSQFEQARDRDKAGKKPKPSLWRQGLDLVPNVGVKTADILANAVDLMSRPGYATTAAAAGLLDPHAKLGDVHNDLWAGLSGKNKKGGAGILEAGGWENSDSVANKIARGAAGLGLDIALDPTTWVSFGGVSAGENIAKNLAEEGVGGVAKKAVKKQYSEIVRDLATGPLRGEKKLAEAELDELANAGIAAHRSKELRLFEEAQTTKNFPASQSQMKMAYDEARKAGKSHDLAEAAARQNLNKTTNEVHDAIRAATQDFGRGRFQLKAGFMGRGPDILEGTKLGERIYRPFEWTAEQLSKTGVGNFVGNAFNYEKHFPGQLAYIRSKATSLGLKNHDDLRMRVNSMFRERVSRDRSRPLAFAVSKGLA